MKQFEYKVAIKRIGIVATTAKLEDRMNARLSELNDELGPEGWELVSCSMSMGEHIVATFKRENRF